MYNGDDTRHIMEPLQLLLQKLPHTPYGYIYLEGDYPWTSASLGFIFPTDRFDSIMLEDENPQLIKTYNLTQVMQTERAIYAMANAFDQKLYPTLDELVACFNFRYAHDGYLELPDTSDM